MRRVPLGLLLGALLALGCSSQDPIYFHSVTMTPGPSLEKSADRLELNLGVEPFAAIAELNSLNLLARDSDEIRRYQTYEITQLWSTLPATMVFESARTWFEPRFAEVETYPGSWVSDLVLRAELTHFEEVRGAGTPRALVGLRYQVLVREMPTEGTRFERIYRPLTQGWLRARGESPLPDRGDLRNGTALTVALSGAMEKAFEEIWGTVLEHREELPMTRGEFRGP